MKNIQEKIKEELGEKKLPAITKELSRSIKIINKTKHKIKTLHEDSEESKELTEYVGKLKEKINFILDSMTQSKIKNTKNLAQLAKALRTVSNLTTIAEGDPIKRSEKKELKVNLNVDGLSKEDLLDLLNKKVNENED